MAYTQTINLTYPADGQTGILISESLTFSYTGTLLPREVWVNGELKVSYPQGSSWGGDETPGELGMPGGVWAYSTTYSWYVRYANYAASRAWVVDHWEYTGLTYANTATRTFTTELGPPIKATNPSPTDAAIDVAVDTSQLSWDDGGGADDFDVWFGPTGSTTLRESGQVGTTWSIPTDELLYNTVYQWGIVSNNAIGATTGDMWSFTTAALLPAVLDSPTDETTGYYLNTDQLAEFNWNHELMNGVFGDYHKFYFGPVGAMEEKVGGHSILDNKYRLCGSENVLEYYTMYEWKVVTIDRGSTVESGTFGLRTMYFLPPLPSGDAPGAGGGEYGGDGGKNNMVTVKRIVAAANDTIFFQDG